MVTRNIERRDTEDRGLGVFALVDIVSGSLILEGTILRYLDRNSQMASEIDDGVFVLHGGLMSNVNHSCDPNCGIRGNDSGAHDLVAMRSISTGEELTFDYAMRNSVVEFFPPNCKCGSAICRTRVLGWHALPVERRRHYAGFVAPHLLDQPLTVQDNYRTSVEVDQSDG